jgi:prepilin-type processing-associated H-X9-DG protein
MSGKGDPRIPAVHEARSFWNAELSKLGTPFRLGPVSHVVEYVQLEEGFYRLRDSLLNVLTKTGGDIMVALSADSTRSFTTRWGSSRKLFTQIASEKSYSLKAPGAARNAVAHELGHAIGLGHSERTNVLMCGGSAWCVTDYLNARGFLPLTDQEKTLLAAMYPRNWKSEPRPIERRIETPPFMDDANPLLDDAAPPGKPPPGSFRMSGSEI